MTILHLDDPAQSDVPIATMVFPDGQPHVSIDPARLCAEVEKNGPVEIITSVKSALRVVEIGLVLDAARAALEANGRRADIALTLSYLLGARMDRRIAPGQPATLHVLGAMLRPCLEGLRAFRILDPHSPVTLEVFPNAKVLVPDALVSLALADMEARSGARAVVVIPDQGAIARTSSILERLGGAHDTARCVKKRDPSTGALSGFEHAAGDVLGRDCLIVDDICDGGGTFSGIASLLRGEGARSVSLLVTHGVFSRGIEIAGIDTTYCTDSYGLPKTEGYVLANDGGFLAYARAGEAPRLRARTAFTREAIRSSLV